MHTRNGIRAFERKTTGSLANHCNVFRMWDPEKKDLQLLRFLSDSPSSSNPFLFHQQLYPRNLHLDPRIRELDFMLISICPIYYLWFGSSTRVSY